MKNDKYINNKYYKSEITGKIIKCAQNVHCFLGNGFQEVIYQRALKKEFLDNNIIFEREKEIPIFYKEKRIGTRRADFLVDGDILLELKAVINLEKVHFAQIMNYIEAYKTRIGLLINFGNRSLEVKRFKIKKPLSEQ